MRILVSTLFLSVWAAAACGDSTPKHAPDGDASSTHDSQTAETTEDSSVTPDTQAQLDGLIGGDGDAATPPTCEAHEPACQDEQFSELVLFENVASGAITEEGTTAGEFLTHIDAVGGGMNPSMSYVYARFTDEGLEKIAISDDDAFTSSEWDLAFRRYFIRLNSGVAGPGCVVAARTAPATTFETLTTVPANLNFHAEQYYTGASCTLVPDTSGLPGPLTVLSSFWSYPGCVKMTGNVYVIQLANGRHVKLQVKSYYNPAVQAGCDEDGALTTPSGAGNFRVRWAFVD